MENTVENMDEQYIEVVEKLKSRGYNVISLSEISRRYCFNIVAHRKDRTLLIRYLKNLDSVPTICIKELKVLAHTINAIPLLVSNRDSRKELSNGIVYMRQGVYSINPRTFIDALTDRYPYVYMDRGGIYININGDKLRRLRLEKNLSLGELADRVGVSRKAIYSYERNIIGTSPEILERLEAILGESIRKPLDIFQKVDTKESPYDTVIKRRLALQSLRKDYEKYKIIRTLNKIAKKTDLRVLLFKRNVFEILTKFKNRNIFMKFIFKLNERVIREVEYTMKIADITNSRPVFIARDKSSVNKLEDIEEDQKIVEKIDEKKLYEVIGINFT